MVKGGGGGKGGVTIPPPTVCGRSNTSPGGGEGAFEPIFQPPPLTMGSQVCPLTIFRGGCLRGRGGGV